MAELEIFKNIDPNDKSRMLDCFCVTQKKYRTGETIMTFSGRVNAVCVLVYGRANGYWIDDDGNTAVIETVRAGDVFGDVFMMPIGKIE